MLEVLRDRWEVQIRHDVQVGVRMRSMSGYKGGRGGGDRLDFLWGVRVVAGGTRACGELLNGARAIRGHGS